MTKYKVETIDMQQSPDGAYELKLQSVGEPYFPFGGAPGRLVLKENETVISRTRFEIANDGGPFTENAWKVTWQDDYVEIILSGQEQFDELFRLYYDGQVESETLDTHYGRDRENWYGYETGENTGGAENEEDDTEEELFSGQWQIEDGYFAIYDLLSDHDTDNFEVCYGASESSTRCVISENDDTIKYLVYDRNSQNDECGLYIYYQSQKAEDGTWSPENAVILDIYAYVHEDGTVVSSGKTAWEDIGTDAYREATGEE
ncbi:MAG: hypothetical protein LUH19_01685 [Lachnospiraceae bacterium]|nr:hypothetical protein [Lachnospiraceae bacterium]